MKNKALILFSGGMDSALCLMYALKEGYDCYCICFDYGQSNSNEINCAKKICETLSVPLNIFSLELGLLTNKGLLSGDIVYKNKELDGVSTAYVPNRNLIFLSLSAAYAETIGCEKLIVGFIKPEKISFTDCSLRFVARAEMLLSLSLSKYITISAPFIYKTKAEMWDYAKKNNYLELLKHTHTCFNNSTQQNEWGVGCDNCGACESRKNGFNQSELCIK